MNQALPCSAHLLNTPPLYAVALNRTPTLVTGHLLNTPLYADALARAHLGARSPVEHAAALRRRARPNTPLGARPLVEHARLPTRAHPSTPWCPRLTRTRRRSVPTRSPEHTLMTGGLEHTGVLRRHARPRTHLGVRSLVEHARLPTRSPEHTKPFP